MSFSNTHLCSILYGSVWLELAESAAGRVVLLQLLSIHDGAVGVTNLDVMLLWWCPLNTEYAPCVSLESQLLRCVYILKNHQILNIVCNGYLWYKMVHVMVQPIKSAIYFWYISISCKWCLLASSCTLTYVNLVTHKLTFGCWLITTSFI